MRRAIMIAVVALLVGLPERATATGPEFIQTVCLEDKPISEAICLGYVAGVADTEDDNGKFCLPLNISNDDLVGVVTASMRKAPDFAHYLASRDYNASVLVGTALARKFPCN